MVMLYGNLWYLIVLSMFMCGHSDASQRIGTPDAVKLSIKNETLLSDSNLRGLNDIMFDVGLKHRKLQTEINALRLN